MGLLITFCLGSIIVSFFCSLCEATLMSTTQSYIKNLNDKSPKIAKLMLNQKKNIDSPLIAILTLNTLAHTFGAAAAGAQAAKIFGNEFLGVFSTILTICILYLSEIIPKTIGANYWQEIAPAVAICLSVMEKITMPLIKFSKMITNRIKKKSHSENIKQDIIAMVNIAKERGVIEDQELRIMQNILASKEIKVASIMTPRTVLFAVDCEMSIQQFLAEHEKNSFSKILIYEEQIDNIVGYVLKQEILEEEKFHRDKKLVQIKKNIINMIDSTKILNALQKMLKYKSKISTIVNEYGTITGIITMEDIIESLLGLEIIDNKDVADDMQLLARFLWKKRIKEKGIVIYKDIDTN